MFWADLGIARREAPLGRRSSSRLGLGELNQRGLSASDNVGG